MGTIWMPGGSGGADTSVVTATAEDVLAPKVIVGPDGEPIDGTMVNNGAVSHSLPINGTYPIPKGYHDGNGKVSQSIPVQGGSTTTPGTANKTIVAANRYVTGNIVVAGSANLVPANIKKGVNIFGVNGIFEGYTTTPLYVFNNGSWNGLQITGATATTSGANAEVGKRTTSSTETTIWIYATNGIDNGQSLGYRLNSAINLSNYNFLKFKVSNEYSGLTSSRLTGYFGASTNAGITNPASLNAYYAMPINPSTGGVYALNISNLNGNHYIYFFIKHNGSSTSGLQALGYGYMAQIILSNT